ncbi:MAG: winged helix-turn-helix domain-containing protein, partial [Gemmatimonadota bacterium]
MNKVDSIFGGTRSRAGAAASPGVPPACCSLDIDRRDEERLIGMFRGLSNPIRFEILQFLLTHPGCITGSIVDHLPRSQATVSQ